MFFVDQAIAQAASVRPYSLATNLISDLGNTACGPDICSPLHTFMNATFVVVGALHGLGAIATYRAWPRTRLSAAGICLLVVAGVGLAVVGLAPENVTSTLSAHIWGTLVGLTALNLAMILLGFAVIRSVRWLGIVAAASGIIGMAEWSSGSPTTPPQ